MKKYYKGNVEVLCVKNLTINKATPNVIQERIIVNRDVLFYKNRLGVIIRFEDKCPIPNYNEVLDYMANHLDGSSNQGIYQSGTYVNEESLVRVEITREQEKKLIKARKGQRRKQTKIEK